MVLFTNDEMVVYSLDEDQNKYNYEALALYNCIDTIKYFIKIFNVYGKFLI